MAVRVAPGSSDPHGIGDTDDRARAAEPRRRPTFAMDAHVPADAAELLARPYPCMNMPQTTGPATRPRADASTRRPPVVTSVQQVVLPSALDRVRQWRRQLRRCLRAAWAGNVKLAVRLRPRDLWIPIDQCMPSETQAWDWDLRPLAQGMPAVAWTPGASEHEPDCDVCVSGLQAASEGFADQGIVGEITWGVSDDADGVIERGVLCCGPHRGGLEHIAAAQAKTAAGVEAGWVELHETMPCWPFRAVPWSVVDESERAGRPKFRVTVDLSWPQPGMMTGVTSVNDASNRGAWPAARMMRLAEMSEAMGILASSGLAVQAWLMDADAFYRRYARRREQWHRQMTVSPEGKWVLDKRPSFGGAAVADKLGIRASHLNAHHIARRLREFDKSHPPVDAAVLRWQEARRGAAAAAGEAPDRVELWAALFVTGTFVDDTTGCSVNDPVFDRGGRPVCDAAGGQMKRAACHLRQASAALRELGHESVEVKEQLGCVVTSLGAEVNLIERRLRLSAEKRERYARMAAEVARERQCKADVFRTLLGRLTFAACLFPRSRQWLYDLHRAARARYRLSSGQILVSRSVRAALLLWHAELVSRGHEGVPLARVCTMPGYGEPGVAAIYADASGSIGFCAWAVLDGVLLLVSGTWSEAEREGLIICEKELLASLLGLECLGPLLQASHIYEFTDNSPAMGAMRTMGPRTPAMQLLVRRRLALAERRGWRLAAERVSTHNNLWADLGSRGRIDEVERQAERLGLRSRHVPVPWESRCTERLLRVALESRVHL